MDGGEEAGLPLPCGTDMERQRRRHMITAVLEHRGDTLVTELPCGLYELQAELSI